MFDIQYHNKDDGVEDAVAGFLKDHNIARGTPLYAEEKFAFSVCNAGGEVIGGLTGNIVWEWMSVGLLAVDQNYQGKGVGSLLMDKAEELARQKKCIAMKLTTLESQAPEFYKRRGFEILSIMPDYPRGDKRYVMVKRLRYDE